jgi:3'(2'),5'-bisphosphate nucleotidase
LKGARHRLSDIEDVFVEAAVAAGREIMLKAGDGLNAARKADGSPVTDADLRAEAVIRARLREALPNVPVIGEEGGAPVTEIASQESFILVDPLDGTRDFLDGAPEFTVNVALIKKGRPVIGVVHAPSLGRLFAGSVGYGAWETTASIPHASVAAATRRELKVRAVPASGPLALESRSHREAATEALLARFGRIRRRMIASSLKFALLAAGEGDLYARGVSLNEWDIAAGDAVLSAAGGAVVTLDNEPLRYGNPGMRAPPFIAVGDQLLRRRIEGAIAGDVPPS